MARQAKISKKKSRGGFGSMPDGSTPQSGYQSNPNASFVNPVPTPLPASPIVAPSMSTTTANNNPADAVKKTTKNVTDWFSGLFKKKDATQTVSSSLAVPATTGGRGKKNKTSKRKRGGYKSSSDYGLASNAAPVGNVKTSMPNSWIGGGKKRKSTVSKKSRKH